MSNTAILVLTSKSAERLVREGGTRAWVLDRSRAAKQDFVVCIQNARAHDFEGSERHGMAFLIGRGLKVVPAPGEPGRWMIRFAEYARVEVPNMWHGERNPVRYATLEELGINPAHLDFRPVPGGEAGGIPVEELQAEPRPTAAPLTIAQAKRGLAVTFGVPEEAIEITVRG